MKCVVFANGAYTTAPWSNGILKDADLVIAADGGAKHALGANIKVDELIGDMDSISIADHETLRDKNCNISVYPQNKDKTDLELAIDLAINKGADEIHILAGDGGRLDHLIANVMISAKGDYLKTNIWFYSHTQRARVISINTAITAKVGSSLSVIPLSAEVKGFSVSGVRWPLKNVELKLGSTFTISNQVTEEQVKIAFEEGIVLLVLDDLAV